MPFLLPLFVNLALGLPQVPPTSNYLATAHENGNPQPSPATTNSNYAALKSSSASTNAGNPALPVHPTLSSSGSHSGVGSTDSKSANPNAGVTFIKNEVKPLDGEGNYSYDIELSDGTKLVQMGHTVAPAGGADSTDSGGLVIEGSYSYVAPDGKMISISYIADDKGFQPKGDAIPTAPTVLSSKGAQKEEPKTTPVAYHQPPQPLATVSSPNLPSDQQGIF